MKTNKTSKVQNPAPIKKIATESVTIKVAKDPENLTGLRGLRGMVFEEMNRAFQAKKDLPTMEALTEKVKEKFPQSRWIARPKIHYSYYKSKFLQSVKA